MNEEKQIEEMAEHLIEIKRNFDEYCAKPCRECELGGVVNCESHYKATALYNAGYRKQSEGEWISTGDKEERYDTLYRCSICGDYSFGGNYCSFCGAKMKGGEE